MSGFDACTAASCISTLAVMKIFTIGGGCWALGYGIGQAVQWTRRIRDAA